MRLTSVAGFGDSDFSWDDIPWLPGGDEDATKSDEYSQGKEDAAQKTASDSEMTTMGLWKKMPKVTAKKSVAKPTVHSPPPAAWTFLSNKRFGVPLYEWLALGAALFALGVVAYKVKS